MSLTFQFLGNYGTSYSAAYKTIDGIIVAPVNAPPFGTFNYVIDSAGDVFRASRNGNNLSFDAYIGVSPTSGIVATTTRLFFFNDNGDGTGTVAESSDGIVFVENAFICDDTLPIAIFFSDESGQLLCVNDMGEIYADVSGNGTDFQLNGEFFPADADVLDTIYVGSDGYAGARFFTYETGASGYTVKTFTYNGGVSVTEACDLPEINSSNFFWSFYRFQDVFYATPSELDGVTLPASSNVMYSSLDALSWSLESASIFNGQQRDNISLLSYGDGDILAGFGSVYPAGAAYSDLYTSGAITPINGGQSGNQGVTGGGVNGAGGAVGFSRVSAAVNFGQSVESLAYPAGIIADGNDFGIDLGL